MTTTVSYEKHAQKKSLIVLTGYVIETYGMQFAEHTLDKSRKVEDLMLCRVNQK
jgi:hypothetical protein